MQPYIVCQGDHLPLLAYKFGFDADTVWNDPTNEQLRKSGKLSTDPNALNPTDMLYIPNPQADQPVSLTTGATNQFTSDVPTMTLNVTFVQGDGTPYASQAFTVTELPELTGLSTKENGLAAIDVPVTLDTATVVFSDSGDSFVLSIGDMNSIDTLSGVFMRLRNLGYIDRGTTFDASQLDLIRNGLRLLKATKGPPPDQGSEGDVDNGGLADDGTLEANTKQLLIDAYGS